MVPGIYTAASGMLAQMDKQDVTTNNLANAATSGFRKDTAVFESFPSYLWGHLQWMGNVLAPMEPGKDPIGIKGQGVQLAATFTNYASAPLRSTGSPNDVALRGPGFFSVQTPAGERYTRDGSFALDGNRALVTQDGRPVLGEQGPVVVNGEKLRVDDGGWVYVDGAKIDRLKIVTFARPTDFEKVGDNLFRAKAETVRVESPVVEQGYVEQSNVNVVREMVDLVTVMRSYEANQRMVIAQDSMLQKAVNEIPRQV